MFFLHTVAYFMISPCISKHTMNYIVVFFFVVSSVQCIDPCTDYIDINDTTLTTSYEPKNEVDISCQKVTAFKWFRYTGTEDGLLTDVCPTGRQCGSHSQIWINDTFPGVTDGERLTKVCIHTETSCYSHKNVIKMKNCSDFMVYFSVHIPPCTNYCFHSPNSVDSTDSVKNENTGTRDSKPWKLPLIVVCSLLLAFVVVVVGVCVLKSICKHQSSVGPQ